MKNGKKYGFVTSVYRRKRTAAIWIATLLYGFASFAGFAVSGRGGGSLPPEAASVTGQSTAENTGNRGEFENPCWSAAKREMKVFLPGLQNSTADGGESPKGRVISASLSLETFDAFDESDKVITGTYEQTPFPLQDPLTQPPAVMDDENQSPANDASPIAPAQGNSRFDNDAAGEDGISIWTLAYLVLSLALLLSLGAGLVTYSLLQKKGKRF